MRLPRLFRPKTAAPLHLVPHPRGWALRPEGGEASMVFRTKTAAVERGLLLAQSRGAKLIVHDDAGEREVL